jgi:DNA-binding helix-hairpin-helix protein with protein kinase domain
MQLRRSSDGQLLSFSSAATLGVGGEARIYVVAAAPGLAAKVYHRPTRDHAAKLAAMLANRPEDPMASQGHVSIAWPSELLIASSATDQVMGFLMPRVMGMSPIIDFYHPKTRMQKHPLFNYRYLLRTARNLAACVSALHARGYVIGDLNESNILLGDTALVTLVDTDSFQVPDEAHGRIHRCRVGKPEFTPPELQSVRFEWVDRKPEHDLFGLAVLFFQVLMEGIHPFAGRHYGQAEPPSLEERITAGSFPYALGGRRHGAGPMPTAPPFELLDPGVRDLFLQCFVEGHSDPSRRPDAQAWQRVLLAAEESLTTCSVNPQHLYRIHLTSCPWCERRELFQGTDSFPSAADLKRRRPGQLTLKPRKPVRTGPVDYETAIEIAQASIARRQQERVVMAVLLVLIAAGLIAYWCWGIQLILLNK